MFSKREFKFLDSYNFIQKY